VTNPARTTIRTTTAPSTGARERLQKARSVSAGNPLVDAEDAATLLGVPATWLLAQARAGHIPHQKLGHYVRFDIDRLIAWLEQNETQTRARSR
jgi:excisionase family DNA binding protein